MKRRWFVTRLVLSIDLHTHRIPTGWLQLIERELFLGGNAARLLKIQFAVTPAALS